MKDKDKGIDLTVCLSPASDPTAGLEAESLVYVAKLQHTIAALPLCGNPVEEHDNWKACVS